MSQPSIPLVNLVGTMLMTLFYGMYFILFCMSVYLHFTRTTKGRRGRGVGSPITSMVFLSGCALFMFITANWILTMVRIFGAFVYFQDGTNAGIYLDDKSQVSDTVGEVFLMLVLVIGDSMIIYRLWVVWSFNLRVIVIPVLSLLGLIVSLIIDIEAMSHLKNLAAGQEQTPLAQTNISQAAFTLATNVYCTAFISWELWRISRYCQPVGGLNLRDFLAILVESAAIYTCWTIYYTIADQLHSTLVFIATGAIPPVVGIANALILVRVGLGRSIERTSTSTGDSTMASVQIARPQQHPEILRLENRSTVKV
ncbi:hypothetical protein C8R44DRAFT_775535 [Mycena epipterygia]|nr:hypothetical protein C8R44DRAFT_775535 [Mycena epipterygia]